MSDCNGKMIAYIVGSPKKVIYDLPYPLQERNRITRKDRQCSGWSFEKKSSYSSSSPSSELHYTPEYQEDNRRFSGIVLRTRSFLDSNLRIFLFNNFRTRGFCSKKYSSKAGTPVSKSAKSALLRIMSLEIEIRARIIVKLFDHILPWYR